MFPLTSIHSKNIDTIVIQTDTLPIDVNATKITTSLDFDTTTPSITTVVEGDAKISEEEKISSVVPETATEVVTEEVDTLTTESSDICSHNGVTYANGDVIVSSEPCNSNCSCVNGNVKCIRESCPPILSKLSRCNAVPAYTEGECCPVYECSGQ